MDPATQATDQELQSAREQLAEASRRVAAKGLVVGTGGNLSVRIKDRVAITATGAVLDSLTAREVSVVDRSGDVIDGQGPSSELFLHLGIYERYGAGAVVHTHSPVATAMACVLEDELPCVHYQMLLLGGAVRVAPYRTFGTSELAQVTLDALEGKTAALMANHGAIVYAQDLDHAVENALLLEWACTVYRHAAAVGEPRVLDERTQQQAVEAAVARQYGSLQPPSDER